MESEARAAPLKVCPRCAVATRTDAATCPSCGKPYQRRLWRWWMAIPIVALAFAVGFFGRKALTDDHDPSAITRQEAEAIEVGSSSDELESAIGEPPLFTQSRGKGEAELDCSYYAIEGEANTTWEFCFQKGDLIASQAVNLE